MPEKKAHQGEHDQLCSVLSDKVSEKAIGFSLKVTPGNLKCTFSGGAEVQNPDESGFKISGMRETRSSKYYPRCKTFFLCLLMVASSKQRVLECKARYCFTILVFIIYI